MAYGLKTKGGNKTLNRHAHDEWAEGKKIGRPKQVWVWDEPINVAAGEQPDGHWEKTK